MSKKNISQEKIIQAFIASAFEKSAGGTSLADISESLEIKKASLRMPALIVTGILFYDPLKAITSHPYPIPSFVV